MNTALNSSTEVGRRSGRTPHCQAIDPILPMLLTALLLTSFSLLNGCNGVGAVGLSSISPTSAQQGQTLSSVVITGTATHFAQATTTASFGVGITVNMLTVTDAIHATANISISPTTATGPRDVTLTTGTQIVKLTNGFTVQAGPAAIGSVNSNSAQQAQANLNVAITGTATHFALGTTVASFGSSDITVNTLTVTDATHATANISISPTAATGPLTVTMTTGGEVATLNNAFTVQSGPAAIASVLPNSGQQGQTLSSVVITGTATHFAQGTTAASFGSGITVSTLTITSATSATASITISATAATGTNAVTLTTGGEVATLANAFTIQPGTPALVSVNPNSGQQAQNLTSVIITGAFTHFVQGTTVASFGVGITVNSLTVTDATHATANISISPTTATGPRTVTMTTGAEAVNLTNGFTVQTGTAAIASIVPNSGTQGQANLDVAITGTATHFAQGTTTASFGSGITVNTLTVTDGTHATANIGISATAAIGSNAVTLTTGGEVATLSNAFTTQPVTATITSLSQNMAPQGQTITDIAITGAFTHFSSTAPATTASFGSGITVNTLTVTDATHATANISVSPTAATGPRTVTMTTGGEVATLNNGFTVQSGPAVIASVAPNSGQQGQTLGSVVITGTATHFAQGTTTANFGAGITVNTLTVNSATSATANITIQPTAPTGTNAVTLTTGGEVATLANGFTVQAGTAVVFSASPNSGPQGQANLNVAITGAFTHFSSTAPATTASFGSGITVNTLTVTDATHAIANISISPTAATGPHTVTMTTGTEVATLNNGFTLQAGPAAISSVVPNSGQQGQTLNSVVITGTATHFVQGTTTADFGAGITVNSLTVNSATSASANITIQPTAATSTNAVTLTTGGEVATLANAFTVQVGTAVVFSAAPNSGQQGQANLNVAITGAFTHFSSTAPATTASFGSGITVNTLTVTDATHATANISVSPTTATGPRTVTMTTGGEVATLNNGFTVQSGPAVIASVAPNGGQQGQTLGSVVVTGTSTNFAQGTTTANFGAGITVNSLTVTSATSATANITIQPTAPTGTNTVTLTTGGEVATLANAFTVQSGPAAIASVLPNSGQQGQTLSSVVITGTATHFAQATTTASFGSGITVNTLTVTDATHATANITIQPTAATGTNAVTLTTGGEVATLANAFTIQPGTPALVSVNPNSGQQGQNLTSVIITGAFTHFVQGTTVASFGGTDITINSLTVTDATDATANISISATAATGPRTVTMTTGAEVATLNNGFTVHLAGVNNSELNGHYVFLLRGFDPGGHAVAIAGSFIADGLGNITGGAMDINGFSSGPSTDLIVNAAASFYTIGADERGMLTLNTPAGTQTFDFAVGPITSGVAAAGHIISRQNTSASNGSTISGSFNQQNTAAFSLSTSTGIGGDFAFGFEGADSGGNRTAGAGRLTINSNAMLTAGSIDVNDNGTFDNGTAGPLAFSGSVDSSGAIDSTTGRGTMTLTITSGPTLHQAFYVGNANFLLIVSTDPVDANHSLYASGASRQSTSFCPSTGGCAFTNNALSGKAVVYIQGNSSSVTGGSKVQVGSLSFFSGTPTGSFSGGFDQNDAGVISTPSTNPVSGNFSVAPNGRVTLTNSGTNPPIIYMAGVNSAVLVGTNGSRVESGSAEPQVFNPGTAPIAFQMVSRSFGANAPAVSGTQAFTGVQMVTNVPNNCGQTGTLFGTTDDANSIAGGLQEDVAVANDNITLDTTTGRTTFASAAQVGYWINRNRRAAIDIQTTVTAPWISISDNEATITTVCVVLP